MIPSGDKRSPITRYKVRQESRTALEENKSRQADQLPITWGRAGR
jgi:hypothetical protein